MIQGFDIKLGGVGYFLDESAEGEHYVLGAQPLRPPNSVTVQGENSQKFQIRPDILQWSITDWSGGEGQLKYDPQFPNRHYTISGSVFEKPGEFHPTWYRIETVDNGGTNSFAVSVCLVRGGSTIYGYATGSTNVYTWDVGNNKWGASASLTGAANAVSVVSDGTYIYLAGASNIYRATIANTTFSTVGSGVGCGFRNGLTTTGDYCYVQKAGSLAISEFLKSGSTPVDIAYFGISNLAHCSLVPMDGKVYAMGSVLDQGTEILEITPTSASGPGFGVQIALIPGFQATSMWSHSGTLFLGGHEVTNQLKTSVMYVTPGGQYGTLGPVNELTSSFAEVPQGTTKLSKWLDHFFWYARGSGNLGPQLLQIDSVSGGFARVSTVGSTALSGVVTPIDAALLGNEMFIATTNTTPTVRIFRVQPSKAGATSVVVTPWSDFGLSGDKILSSIDLSCTTIPSGWTIDIGAAYDGAVNFNSVGSYTAGSSGGRTAITTGASTKTFNTVRFSITLNGPSTGPTTWPVVLGLDVFAQIARPFKVWNLLLNLSDDHSEGEGFSGARKISNLNTLSATKAATTFQDGYYDRTPGTSTTYDVIVDSFEMNLTKPGEGVAKVTLVEVA